MLVRYAFQQIHLNVNKEGYFDYSNYMAIYLCFLVLGLLHFLGDQGCQNGKDGLGLFYRRPADSGLGIRPGGNRDQLLRLDLHGPPRTGLL